MSVILETRESQRCAFHYVGPSLHSVNENSPDKSHRVAYISERSGALVPNLITSFQAWVDPLYEYCPNCQNWTVRAKVLGDVPAVHGVRHFRCLTQRGVRASAYNRSRGAVHDDNINLRLDSPIVRVGLEYRCPAPRRVIEYTGSQKCYNARR